MKMLEGLADLTLEQLNDVTQAWVEIEYNTRCIRDRQLASRAVCQGARRDAR